MYNLFKLNNGLRVIIENIDYVNSVTVGLWVENGSRNESSTNNGISHFIEHMFFKGTENRNAKEIVETVENVGGQINAFTGKESTCFYIKTLDTHLELDLELLSDMLFNSTFTHEDIEKEKKVIIEEIKMSNDSPEDVLIDLHAIAAFREDSIAMPIVGTVDTVQSFTREMLIEYVDSYYIPENSVISICGKFDVKNIEKIVENFFGNWYSSNKKITNYSVPEIVNDNLFQNKNIEQLHISLGIKGIEVGGDDVYTLMLLNTIIGGGASSILFQKIREDLGMCYSIYSYISSFINCGMINIYTSLNPNYAVDALNYIKKEIYNFSKQEINNEKLLKLKEQLKGNFILGLESTSSRMFRNGRIALFLNKIIKPSDMITKIDSVNKYKMVEVMKNTFKLGIQNSAFVGENFNKELITEVLEIDKTAFENSKKIEL
ncbi:M16 family metallopeptidase [Clostridium ganghwense]|uniref:Pitrilysin family protein n=1 Tax=Clostridium ganghwense TaxID=312089 RepID=A0ABT4CXA7_9CLOT|nr:pitrilysin family protein [Clostridium ganghwense]MCY6372524.1 pitrilysin family protein [Clostridium ganghwense]